MSNAPSPCTHAVVRLLPPAKTALKSAGIAYDEVDIEHDPPAAEFVGSVNGGNQVVPTLKFADGSTLTNPGAARSRRSWP